MTETVKNGKESVTTVYTYNEQNRLTKAVANKGGEKERIDYVGLYYIKSSNKPNKQPVGFYYEEITKHWFYFIGKPPYT